MCIVLRQAVADLLTDMIGHLLNDGVQDREATAAAWKLCVTGVVGVIKDFATGVNIKNLEKAKSCDGYGNAFRSPINYPT